ncbi:hypothetical protein ACCAA_30057 [Candidatus Accumulibacter aalborgensis]|uniref:Uncharacterized protein n=1 Tax=Candidatus Accumulibacter aalborgensis TaxID=1860102 RepID=A0A1A8XLU5_9PROT|nr:hypothetical protein ACCAA_30057 [Candidatus Accumulibacter aalborgensis]
MLATRIRWIACQSTLHGSLVLTKPLESLFTVPVAHRSSAHCCGPWYPWRSKSGGRIKKCNPWG